MRGRGYSDRTLALAKKLRREPTEAEKRLWSKLRSRQLLGFKFRQQQPISRYVVDFVCQERRLIVELDGGQHAESARDLTRTADLESIGYTVIRFWNNDVLQNTDGVLLRIAQHLQSSPSPTSARRQGRQAFVSSPSRGEEETP